MQQNSTNIETLVDYMWVAEGSQWRIGAWQQRYTDQTQTGWANKPLSLCNNVEGVSP